MNFSKEERRKIGIEGMSRMGLERDSKKEIVRNKWKKFGNK